METQRLVDFKTLMYVEGISACIEGGKWDKLEPDAQIEGFGHVFVMRARGDVLLGRMWSSSDGKGRTKYPMVVLSQCTGAGIEWCIQNILPELEAIQQRCQQATTAAEVVGILDASRQSLRAKVAAAPQGGADLVIPANFVQTLASRPEVGPNAQGLHRVLYQINREMSDYLLGVQPASKFGRMEPQACHMRVPALVGGPGESLLGWARVMLSKLESWSPLLLIASLSRPFVDVLVGEPNGQQLVCLRSDQKAIPLTSEIPYTLDPAFLAETAAWMNARAAMGDAIIQSQPQSVFRKPGSGRFRMALVPMVLATIAGSVVSSDVLAQAPQSEPQTFVEPRLRYNQALQAFKASLAGADEAKARTAARTFLTTVDALPGGIAYMGEVQPLLRSVRTILDAPPGAGALESTLDPTKLGPATTGLYVGTLESDLIRFKPNPGLTLPELVFAKVALTQGDAPPQIAYIGTTEVSVSMFGQILASMGAGQDSSKILTRFDRISDPRVGPRTWEWGPKGVIVPAADWFVKTRSGMYAPELRVSPPSGDSPVQFVGPAASLYVARLAGCRLPTVAEWRATLSTYPQLVGKCNVRDRSWVVQRDYAESTGLGVRVELADLSAFNDPAGPGKVAESEDGALLFSPVQAGCGEKVINLVGNVWEWVLDGASADGVAAKVAAIDTFVTEHAAAIRVVGGSAFSDGSDPASPREVEAFAAREGYSDVGFRLAFGASAAKPMSLKAQLDRLLEPLPLLTVR